MLYINQINTDTYTCISFFELACLSSVRNIFLCKIRKSTCFFLKVKSFFEVGDMPAMLFTVLSQLKFLVKRVHFNVCGLNQC